jgi:DNA-binding PadR family transcriptional regulator
MFATSRTYSPHLTVAVLSQLDNRKEPHSVADGYLLSRVLSWTPYFLDGCIAYRYSGLMNTSETSLAGLGRNAAAAVLVLSSLAGGDKHGYALVKDVEEFAGVHLPPGTLYQLLARLESRGMITALRADDRRRPYRLTAQGATVLADYITAQQRILKTGQARLKRSWTLA